MRLPYLQVDQDAWMRAKSLARLLGIHRQHAMGLMLDLWQWAVDLAPEDAPVTGDVVDQDNELLCAAVEWMGDGEKLASGLERGGVIIRTATGFRVKGLPRYSAVLEERRKDRERKRTSKEVPRPSGGIPPESAGHPPDSTRKTQTQTHTQIEEKEEEESKSACADPPPSVAPAFEALDDAAEDATPASPKATPAQLQALWNETASTELPRWREMSAGRRAKAKLRLSERSLVEWRLVFERINASPFCRGQNDRGWQASPDWILKPDTAAKVLEGAYQSTAPPSKGRATDADKQWEPLSDEETFINANGTREMLL